MSTTIFAVASARGKAGVTVIRISGPKALTALLAFGVAGVAPRRASLRRLRRGDDVIDEALVLHFPTGQSFTGEEVVEFQVHGSVAVVSAILESLGKVPGFRPALAGEFTRRALENGKLDLTQVEGLADLIDAETEAQRLQAQRVLSGSIGERVGAWRRDLLRALALIEATIDFSEEDVPDSILAEVVQLVRELRDIFQREIDGSRVSERVRDGFEVALIGAPNVGKSSLLNALAGRDAAITSTVAGTTRDVIEVRMDIGGFPVTLLDTAGIRDTDDEVERIGIARTLERAGSADLRILLVEPEMKADDLAVLSADLVFETKADAFPGQDRISSRTGEGLDRLLHQVEVMLQDRVASAGVMTRERHRRSMENALERLESALMWLDDGFDYSEFVAADLGSAAQSLAHLVGKIGVESLLDEIFSSFCIGK